jgi:hypothetical protein
MHQHISDVNFMPLFFLIFSKWLTFSVFTKVTIGIGDDIHREKASARLLSWGKISVFMVPLPFIYQYQTVCLFAYFAYLPHSPYGYAARQIFIVTAALPDCVAADAPAFGHFHLAADGKNKVRFVLHIAHIIRVGLVAHVAVTQSGFRSG